MAGVLERRVTKATSRVQKMNNPIAWILCVSLGICIILAIIPAWHELISNLTADLEPTFRILFRFVLDPTEYVWKWIAGALILAIAFFSKTR